MTRFYIGCSGFYNRHYKGFFYPEGLPQKQWLDYYSQQFNTLELNSTFYKFPTLRIMTNWYNRTPEHFKFSVKAPKVITHLKKFNDCRELVDEFYSVCRNGLKEKLACLLFQMPPSFQFEEARLQQILQLLNPEFKNVLEFRHPSWWTEPVYEELKKHQTIFCSIDHPSLKNRWNNDNFIFYIRLHGSPELFYSAYDNPYLLNLKDYILASPQIQEAYIYFNNTAGQAGIQNALELKTMLG